MSARAWSVVWRPRWLRVEAGMEVSSLGRGHVSICGWVVRGGDRKEARVIWRARKTKHRNLLLV